MSSAATQARLSQSPRRGRWLFKLFRQDLIGSLAVLVVIAIIMIAIAAPVVSPHSPTDQSLIQRLKAPTIEHPFGTDGLGRDVMSRVIWGSRVSLTVGICAALLTVVIGAVVGAIAGFFGPVADQIVMRLTDVVMAIPSVLLILLIVAIFGEGLLLTVLAIGAVSWPGTARLLRAEFLRLRTLEFVDASRVSGASSLRIMTRHLFPNAAAPLIVQASLLIAESILIESGLSYLGLGVQPPTPSWGNMLFEGRRFIDVAWWISTWPGVAIFLMVISLNLTGDVVRDALDPRTKKR